MRRRLTPSELTSAATSIQTPSTPPFQTRLLQARNGNIDLLKGEVQQSTLGWTAAGAYYLEIAKANAATLSLLTATPVVTPPTYDGLGPSLVQDLAPVSSRLAGLHERASDRRANAGLDTRRPPASPKPLPATAGQQAQSLLTRLFNGIGSHRLRC